MEYWCVSKMKYSWLMMMIIGSVMVSGIEGGCIEEERNALLQIKTSLIDSYGLDVDHILPSWIDDGGECCDWEKVNCNTTTAHVIGISLEKVMNGGCKRNWPLNVSLFLHFKELTSLNLSSSCLDDGIVDTGLGRLSSLKNLEILDLSDNRIGNEIFRSLGALTSLRVLHLGDNELKGYLPALGMFFGPFIYFCNTYLQQHACSNYMLITSILDKFAALDNLEILDLSWNLMQGFERVSILKKLKILNLRGNVFNESLITSLSALPLLESLDLSLNELHGLFPPKDLSHLRDLKVLLLRGNFFNGMLPMEALTSFHNLEVLDLTENSFVGSIPSTIHAFSPLRVVSFAYNNLNGSILGLCELKNLYELDLSHNMFDGILPQCFSRLSSLKKLDISSNGFTGILSPSLIANLTSLEYIDVSGNKFEGSFSFNSFSNHAKLEVVRFISVNGKFEVETEEPISWIPMFQLKVLVLSGCNINRLKGSVVPRFLVHQRELRVIDLSHNSLVGPFPNWLIENNTMLEALNLRNNLLSGFICMPRYRNANIKLLDVSGNHMNGTIPADIQKLLPNITSLNLSSNSLDGVIPTSIGDMSGLRALDLSDNEFLGEVPKELLTNIPLQILKLSKNLLHGMVLSGNLSFRIPWLALDNNCFTGKIGNGTNKEPYMVILDISNNFLTGTIPHWISNMSYVFELVARNNSLEGEFPCGKTPFLFLDISQNSFSGPIPSCLNFQEMKHLHLGSNKFTGSIPNALRNLNSVLTLDVGNNSLSGRIPEFIGTLSNLRILILRNNNFSGSIPKQLCELSNVSLIDLSSNSLFGSIPHCFHKIFRPIYPSFMDRINEFQGFFYDYQSVLHAWPYLYLMSEVFEIEDEIQFSTKTFYLAYRGTILDYMVGLDLSANKLTGEIPEELGLLSEILSLNLSHNQLTGTIPVQFIDLEMIESLDLSSNCLSGEVPSQLIQLHYLSVFNVSYNNLSGRLPEMKAQFSTFTKASYEGNPLLCGPPLEENCSSTASHVEDTSAEEVTNKGFGIDMALFYASFCATWVAFLLGFGVLLYANPYFRRRWLDLVEECMYACHHFLNDLIRKPSTFFSK